VGGILRGSDYGDFYGGAVAVSQDGTRMVVSAKNEDTTLTKTGSVTIYEKSGRSWNQLGQTLYGQIVNERYGYAVSISGDGSTIAVGSPWNAASGTESGTVRIYKYVYVDTTAVWSWVVEGNMLHGDQPYDRFGSSVSLNYDGTRVVGGSPHSNTRGINSGQVLPYEYSGGAWLVQGTEIRGGGIGFKLGTALATNGEGDVMILGSPFHETSGGDVTGGAMVMEWTFQWSQKGSELEGRHVDDAFGTSVAIDKLGETVAVGAPGVSLSEAAVYTGDAANRGYVDVYSWEMVTWEVYDWKLKAHLMGADAEQEYFGFSVSLSMLGDYAAVGAPEVSINGKALTGEVTVFHRADNIWAQHGDSLTGRRGGGYYGSSVVLSGDGSAVIIGSPGPLDDSFTSGSVAMYEVIEPTSSSSSMDANDILAITNLTLLFVLFVFTVYAFFHSKRETRRAQIVYETSEAIDENNKRENVNMSF